MKIAAEDHPSRPSSLVVHEDGSPLLIGDVDGFVTRWTTRDIKNRTRLQVSSRMISSITLSSDGKYAACSSFDREGANMFIFKLNDISSITKHFVCHNGVYGVRFNPSGKHIVAVGADDILHIFTITEIKKR